MKNFLLSIVLLTSIHTFSQLVISNYSTSTVTCDGFAFLSDSLLIDTTGIFWTFNDATTPDVQNGLGVYSVNGLCPGNYIVCFHYYGDPQVYCYMFTIDDLNPCITTLLNALVVNAADSSLCNGSVILDPTSPYYPITFTWPNGESQDLVDTNPNNPFLNLTIDSLCVGTHYFTATNSEGCVFFDSIEVQIQDLDSLELNCGHCVSPSGNAFGTILDCALNYDAVGAIMQDNGWIWQNQNSAIVGIHVYDTLGELMNDYDVLFVLENPSYYDGCFDTELTIHCDSFQTLIYNCVLSYNYIAIDEEVQQKLELFPNPTYSKLNITKNEEDVVEIIDLQGNIIIKTKENIIDVVHLKEGLYMLRLNGFSTRFIKTN